MEVYYSLSEIESFTLSSAVAIGNFDGIHLGHAELLRGTCEFARLNSLTPVVLTFSPHPIEVLFPNKHIELLTTQPEKLEEFSKLGIKKVLVANFDKSLSLLSPQVFFNLFLVNGLKAKSIHVGYDFHFGRGRKGDIETLKKLCEPINTSLHVLPPFNLAGRVISSTAIRGYIKEGKVEEAGSLLGRPYSISGKVLHGDGRGRGIGFPTANLEYYKKKVIPKHGVYSSISYVNGQRRLSVTNIGVRPTFHRDSDPVVVEVHMIDFSRQIYGELLRVELIDRLRDEKRFESVEQLKAQINLDLIAAKKALAESH